MAQFSVCELTTIHLSFDEEVELLRRLGVRGMGIFEPKLPEGEDAESSRKLREAGITATVCIPGTLAILPLSNFPGPAEPEVRVEQICAQIRRLAAFEPVTAMCLTGPQGDYEADEARRIVVEGLRQIARTAREVGVPIGLEPIHESARHIFTLVTTLPETVELVEEAGEPNLGILFDTWHLWDTPDVLDHIRSEARRFVPGIHIDDWREPTRGWTDRALPGEGAVDLPALFGALEAGGWDGWCDLEFLSDDGSLEVDYPDSLWREHSPEELIRRGREGFERAWAKRVVPA
jgi:sugar phosphate isomerase/epimerase